VEKWNWGEVESLLLFESFSSVYSEVFSREINLEWILFFQQCKDIKILQERCIKELAKRSEAGQSKDDLEAWRLPSERFYHRLTSVGLLEEREVWCFHRTFKEQLRTKVNLSELESNPTVEVPFLEDENPNNHKGDFIRYNIHARRREAEPDIQTQAQETELPKAFMPNLQRKRKNEDQDAFKTSSSTDQESTTGLVSLESSDTNFMRREKSIKEIQWFSVEEAKRECIHFARISQMDVFQRELAKIQ
jgi:hypothetical protein